MYFRCWMTLTKHCYCISYIFTVHSCTFASMVHTPLYLLYLTHIINLRVLIAHWLEYCTANLQVVSSNQAHTCVCGMFP